MQGRLFRNKLQLTLLVIFVGVSGCCQNLVAHEEVHREGAPHILNVPDVRQATSYTCGVACAQAILNYYGIDEREDRLVEQFGATAEHGTSPSQLLAGFALYGLTAVLKEQTTLDDLRMNLEQNIPPMVAIQAWLEKYPPLDWSQTWEAGHWVIVVGLDERNIYFEDPSILGTRGWLTQVEFLERWHDYTGEPPCCDEKDRQFRQVSISVKGYTVKVPAFRHID
jgi:uncharacterized protein